MKKNIDRRTFIKGSAIAGMAGMVATSPASGMLSPESGIRQSLNDTPDDKSLTQAKDFQFNKSGKFKILQLTDTHYIAGDDRSEAALNNVRQMLELEKPDLVIHTGDVIFGKPAEKSLRQILKPMSDKKVPFAVTFGNHDDEFDKTREELYDIIGTIPYSVTSSTKNIYGVTNYALTLSSYANKNIKWVLYLFDSNSYPTINDFKGYGHIHFDQIAWYRQQSRYFAEMNGGKPIPALAFFHIPLPEYKDAIDNNKDGFMTGTRGESICSPDINSGLYVSMKEMGDIQAVFAGHDHNNDFASRWGNMFFIYGRFSGCDTVYNDLKPGGGRVIELTEGEEGFSSWIRLYGGKTIQYARYPYDFLKKQN